jgi:hypothetical protein
MCGGFIMISEVKFEKGRSVRLFLIDGESEGRYQIDMVSGITRAYKIPRSLITKSFSDIEDLQIPAVYFLFRKNDSEEIEKPYSVYIGETENSNERLIDHMRNKKWFEEAVIIVTSNGFLNKAHVKYLESVFTQLAVDADIYDVQKGRESNPSRLSDADISDLQVVIQEAKILLPTLGYKFIEKTNKKSTERKEETGRKIFIKKGKADVTAIQTENSVILKKGSKIKSDVTADYDLPKKLREKFEDRIVDATLTEDIEFISLNQAVIFVLGYSVSAPEVCKIETDGKLITLNELKKVEAATTDVGSPTTE